MNLLGLGLKDLLTLLLAVYGAVISTILAFKKLREYKYKVLLFCTVELEEPVKDEDGKKLFVTLQAVNVGHRDLEIEELGFLDSNKFPVSRKKCQPPIRLSPDSSTIHRFSGEEIFSKLDSLRMAFASDSVKRLYTLALPTAFKKTLVTDARVELALSIMKRNVRSIERIDQAVSNAEEKWKRDTDAFEQAFKEEQERELERQREYDMYRAETGQIHPDEKSEVELMIKKLNEEKKMASLPEEKKE